MISPSGKIQSSGGVKSATSIGRRTKLFPYRESERKVGTPAGIPFTLQKPDIQFDL